MKVEILGHVYTVDYSVKVNGDLNMGKCNSAMGQIWVSDELPEDHQASTLLHEEIEAINDMLELGLTHTQICGLTIGLSTVKVIDNG